MSDIKWIKILVDIFDDEKILLIENMPDADSTIVIWFKLLCLAGKQNNSGVFTIHDKIPFTEEMFAAIFRRPLNTVRMALRLFEQYGMVAVINGTVTIPNWGKHQTLDRLEAKREYMRRYMVFYREKQKRIANGESKVNGEAYSEADSEAHGEVNVNSLDKKESKNKNKKKSVAEAQPKGFDLFWLHYPKKVGKANAMKAFAKLSPDENLLNDICLAVELHKKSAQWRRDDGTYIPHPSTWLNQRRWEDQMTVHPFTMETKEGEVLRD